MSSHTIEARGKKTFWEVLTSEKYYPWLLISPLLLTLLIFMLYPMFHSIYYSTQQFVPGRPSVFVGLENFREVLADAEFWAALGRNFQIIVICIVVEIVLGMAIAILWYRKFKGENIIRALCLMPLLISPLVMSLMWDYILDFDLGVINQVLNAIGLSQVQWFTSGWALLTVALMTSWQWLPFSIFVLFAGMRSLPRDVFEAAKVDGASTWYTFRRLTLPMLAPLILIIIMLRTMWLIRLYDPLYGTTGGGLGTEVLDVLVLRVSFKFFDIGTGSAMALIALLITIAFSAILFRYLIKVMSLKTTE